jgi:hypothetical protein
MAASGPGDGEVSRRTPPGFRIHEPPGALIGTDRRPRSPAPLLPSRKAAASVTLPARRQSSTLGCRPCGCKARESGSRFALGALPCASRSRGFARCHPCGFGQVLATEFRVTPLRDPCSAGSRRLLRHGEWPRSRETLADFGVASASTILSVHRRCAKAALPFAGHLDRADRLGAGIHGVLLCLGCCARGSSLLQRLHPRGRSVTERLQSPPGA